jgi:hypothetical protein
MIPMARIGPVMFVLSHPFAKSAKGWGIEGFVVSHPFAKNAKGWGTEGFLLEPSEICLKTLAMCCLKSAAGRGDRDTCPLVPQSGCE